MSKRLNGILAHPLTSFEEFERLPERLRAVSDAAWRVFDEYAGRPMARVDYDRWRITVRGGPAARTTPRAQWEAGCGPLIRGPGDLTGQNSLTFGRHCVSVLTVAKWRVAIASPALLRAARELLTRLGTVLRSEAMILYQDEIDTAAERVIDGLTLDQIKEQMVCGAGFAPRWNWRNC